ncbi:MAG: alpha-glucoside-specific PTS transporter subunit IIBC [Bacillus sp. (in: firmicutes)]
MMQKIQRFGGAMFVPVLLFPFVGIVIGFTILFKNPAIMGSIAESDTLWYQIWYIVEEGAWTVFRQMPLIFVVGIAIGLAKKAQARATLEAVVLYLTFNYFVSAILTVWGPTFNVDMSAEVGGESGLAMIAGIKTLDTSIIGAIIISSIVVYLHNRYFDTKLPDFLGIFQGTSFIVIIGFIAMIPMALLTAWIWPIIQGGISSMQGFLSESGVFGVWLFTFLERILIPTGLHHFIYTPFTLGPVAVEGGIIQYWNQHLSEFAASSAPLKELFPQGGFALYGNGKMFAIPGIALAIYATAKPENKKKVAALLIPATLTSVVAGITEPLEFTFLFIAPLLFVVHALLTATMAATMYSFGVVGNMTGGIIETASSNWIPLFSSHGMTYVTQFIIGFAFMAIYFFVFRFLIQKMKLATPGREAEDEQETKLYSKQDYLEKKAQKEVAVTKSENYRIKASEYLDALGGPGNIVDVTNCATRLRVSVRDEKIVEPDSAFKAAGAHGIVRNGKAIQVIVGLSVPQIREEFENLLEEDARIS